jgi:hypothetical protein
MAAFDFGGLLGSNLFGGGDTGLEEYLTPEQRARMSSQGIMALAASLLKSSGPSAVPIGLGQALGEAYGAGQQGYQQAQQGAISNITTKQKLDEYKRNQEMLSGMQKMLMGDMTGGMPVAASPVAGMPITSEQSLAIPNMQAGPTVARANMVGQLPTPAQVQPLQMAQGGQPQDNPFANLSQAQKALMLSLPRDQLGKAMTDVIAASQEFGAPQNLMIGNKPVVVQYNRQGQRRIVSDAQPYEAMPTDIRSIEYIQGTPLGGTGSEGMAKLGAYRAQGATKVNVPIDIGQKGFENEMKLGGAFKNEPIYKDFNDMKSAYSQVVSSLKQGTPIGDVAGATKVKKLLDPGSVVRESELGIAMAAGGRMDRLQNYFDNWMSGQTLTPTMRDDFQKLSNELYAAAGQAYNQKRAEYEDFGRAYGFKNLGTALGGKADVPSIMNTPKTKNKIKRPDDVQSILDNYNRGE